MGGNRKHGFMRGNASGRNGTGTPNPWYCDGCDKIHGGQVFKNGYNGKLLCDRRYLKLKELEVK